ncbi:hypothetical protein CLOP_g4626 [Closterium sp. NIES-67]|nr:hypothetical protein CLOP_g4626 [Closterium sp. NIES-67]
MASTDSGATTSSPPSGSDADYLTSGSDFSGPTAAMDGDADVPQPPDSDADTSSYERVEPFRCKLYSVPRRHGNPEKIVDDPVMAPINSSIWSRTDDDGSHLLLASAMPPLPRIEACHKRPVLSRMLAKKHYSYRASRREPFLSPVREPEAYVIQSEPFPHLPVLTPPTFLDLKPGKRRHMFF